MQRVESQQAKITPPRLLYIGASCGSFLLFLGKQKFWNAGDWRYSAKGAEPSDGTSMLYLDIVCIDTVVPNHSEYDWEGRVQNNWSNRATTNARRAVEVFQLFFAICRER